MKLFHLKTRRTLLLILCSVLMLTGCLTPRVADKWINKKYEGAIPKKQRNSDYITVKMPALSEVNSDILSRSEKKHMKMIPALFYWKWDYGTISTLNQNVPASYFNSTLITYANTKRLRQKLNGQTIEFTINKLPSVFILTDKGWMVYMVLFYFGKESIFVEPVKEDVTVSYRILKDGTETKNGTITLTDRNQAQYKKMFRSVRKTFWNYLDEYNNNEQAMGKELVDRLIMEL